jgi:hypothetical protein
MSAAKGKILTAVEGLRRSRKRLGATARTGNDDPRPLTIAVWHWRLDEAERR